MFGMSLTEILVILLAALLVLGPERLPDMARTLGKWMREVRRASNLFRDAFMLEDDGSSGSRSDQFRRMLEGDDSSSSSSTSSSKQPRPRPEDGPIDVPADQAQGPPGSVARPDHSPMPTPAVRPVALMNPRRPAADSATIRRVELAPRRGAEDAQRASQDRVDIEAAPVMPW